MEIPNTIDADGKEACFMPLAYETFAMRRLLWRELGLRYDDMEHREILETMKFMDLERKHPYRQERARKEAERKQH